MNKFLKPFIKVCFVNLYFSKEKAILLIEVSKNGNVISKEKKEFENCFLSEGISTNLINYLQRMKNTYDFLYISILDTSSMQGSFSKGCPGYKDKFLIENVIYKESNNKFFYTFLGNITKIKNVFKKSGIDFILSPFLILDKFKHNVYLDGKERVFILNSFGFIAIAIYNKNKLKFSSFFTLSTSSIIEEDINIDEDEEDENIIELDLIDDDNDLFNDEIDTEALLNAVEHENDMDGNGEDLDIFSRDLKMIEYLKNSISEYYKNELYDSDFVEEVVIYSDITLSQEVSQMIEDQLFLSTKVEQKYFLNTINNLTREEYESI